MADHLFRLVIDEVSSTPEIDDSFPDDQLMNLAPVDETSWFANTANYLASRVLPTGLSAHYRKNFFHDLRYYYWDDPLLFRSCANDMLHCCALEFEVQSIIKHYHDLPCGGHAAASKTSSKILQCGF